MRETNIQSIEKRVYELEKGGGGGGTSNYEQLTNRPKIEGKTLSGNMTFEDLGIASAVDLAQTDGDLQDLADKFSPIYYTDDNAALDVVLHAVITDSNLPTNEARVFVIKCDKGWFICNAQRSTDNYTGMAIQQSGTDRYTFHGSIGGTQTIVTPFVSGGGLTLDLLAQSSSTGYTRDIVVENVANYKLLMLIMYIGDTSYNTALLPVSESIVGQHLTCNMYTGTNRYYSQCDIKTATTVDLDNNVSNVKCVLYGIK